MFANTKSTFNNAHNFEQLDTLIANISGADQAIDKLKMALSLVS